MAWGGAPTRGAPTNCLFSALWPGEGTHKGCPYRFAMPWGGHPQGAPLPIVFSRRYGRGRAPTRGAPTDCLLSALWPGEGAHKGRPYRLAMPGGGHPQGAPLPDSLCPGEGAHKGRPYPIQAALRGFVTIGWNCPAFWDAPGCDGQGGGTVRKSKKLLHRVTVGGCKIAQTFLSVYQ